MTTEEENELTRLRLRSEDLKLLHEANLLMIDMAKERFGIDIKKLRGDVIRRVLEGSARRKGTTTSSLDGCGHFGYSEAGLLPRAAGWRQTGEGVLPSIARPGHTRGHAKPRRGETMEEAKFQRCPGRA